MTIRITEPSTKYGWLHPAAAYGFMTSDGAWWRSLEDWLRAHGVIDSVAAFATEEAIDALRLKFAFNHDLREKLVATGKKSIQAKRRTPYHWLGSALMQIRRELQSGAWTRYVPWTPFSEAGFQEEETKLLKQARADDYVGVFINSRYQVVLSQVAVKGFPGPVDHLSIKRWDKGTVRDWRELQRIKNEICGPLREACEIYPSERRLVDTANQYHLWVLPPDVQFPFGFPERLVSDETAGALNARQRPFNNPPEDLVPGSELDGLIKGSGED